jgi:hypothetical protein
MGRNNVVHDPGVHSKVGNKLQEEPTAGQSQDKCKNLLLFCGAGRIDLYTRPRSKNTTFGNFLFWKFDTKFIF